MKIAKIVLASSAALAVFSSVTLAQQAMTGTGTITTIDRISGTIAIRQTQSGTVGANAVNVANEFKLQGGSLDAWHAGDKVTFSAAALRATAEGVTRHFIVAERRITLSLIRPAGCYALKARIDKARGFTPADSCFT
jgi:hypothetical protein